MFHVAPILRTEGEYERRHIMPMQRNGHHLHAQLYAKEAAKHAVTLWPATEIAMAKKEFME